MSPSSANKVVHYGFENQRRRPNRGISGLTKRTCVLQKFEEINCNLYFFDITAVLLRWGLQSGVGAGRSENDAGRWRRCAQPAPSAVAVGPVGRRIARYVPSLAFPFVSPNRHTNDHCRAMQSWGRSSIPLRRGRHYTILPNFPKNYMKLRNFWTVGGARLLDPQMQIWDFSENTP